MNGAVNPEDDFSKEHWMSSIGLASLVGGARVGVPTKRSVISPTNSLKKNPIVEKDQNNSILSFADMMDDEGANRYSQFWDYTQKNISVEDRIKLSDWNYSPSGHLYEKYKMTFDDPKYYDQKTGDINWTPNNGFEGEPQPMILSKETLIDRYGFPEGSFFSEKGVPYEQRALALHSDTADYHIYKVLENLEVMGGKAAPWFDRVGGGIQFIKYHKNGKTYSLQELIDEDLIVEVTFEREE